jgi:hypothetical protein
LLANHLPLILVCLGGEAWLRQTQSYTKHSRSIDQGLCYHPAGVPMEHMSVVVQQLKRERQYVQQQLQRIDEALTALGGSPNGASRTISAAGRRRISLAQKARWAKKRTAKPKRTMSVAARKKIAAAQRARWAKVKKAT